MASSRPAAAPRAPSTPRTASAAAAAAAGTPVPIEINVSEPWFSAIASRAKTVEGRLCKGKFADLRAGSVLLISRNPSGGSATRSRGSTRSPAAVVAVVTRVERYPSFEEYLAVEGLANTLPGVRSLQDGVAVYRQFYSADMERAHGVAAIHLLVV